MATVTLKGSGKKMPLVGFGCWKLDKTTCAETVYNAIKTGYRLFDCAGDYGNEKQCGEGLQKALKEGLVKREEVFITSKLWNTFHKAEHVQAFAKKQLADWQLEYFDLFLIHFPVALKYVDPSHRYPPEWFGDDGKTVELQNTPIQETWEAMEKLVDQGLAKDIGVSNFSGGLLCDLLRYAKKPVSALQIEHHPYLTQDALVKFAQSQGIAITAYCSFGPQSWEELGMHIGTKSLLKEPVEQEAEETRTIAPIADSLNKTSAQVLLRWATQRGIAVIPKSNKQERLEENLHCTDFTISDADMAKISSLNQNLRFNDPGSIDIRLSIFA